MNDPKYDYKAGCTDFDPLGSPCPFYDGGKCHIAGFRNPEPIPEDGVCDKTPAPLTTATVVRFDIGDEELRELEDLYVSKVYRDWQKWKKFYDRPDTLIREEVFTRLWVAYLYATSRGNLSQRVFKKKFKPNDIGVGPHEAPSFRTRVLAALNNKVSLAPASPERVALMGHRVDGFHLGTPFVDWELEIFTSDTVFEDEYRNARLDAFDGTDLMNLLEAHPGQKILIEWAWWSSVTSGYPDPVEYDSGPEYVRLVRVLS